MVFVASPLYFQVFFFFIIIILFIFMLNSSSSSDLHHLRDTVFSSFWWTLRFLSLSSLKCKYTVVVKSEKEMKGEEGWPHHPHTPTFAHDKYRLGFFFLHFFLFWLTPFHCIFCSSGGGDGRWRRGVSFDLEGFDRKWLKMDRLSISCQTHTHWKKMLSRSGGKVVGSRLCEGWDVCLFVWDVYCRFDVFCVCVKDANFVSKERNVWMNVSIWM